MAAAGGSGIRAATPAFSQAPTEAQREAIKSECRSDYIAHCSSIPPGGEASLQCLQKNMSSLAPGCQSAVRAVAAPAEKAEPKAEAKPEPKPESAPAASEAKPAPEPAAPRLHRPPRRRQARRPRSRAARRYRRSAAPAAPIIQRSAPAFRPAALRRCNAWRRTSRRSRRAAKKPSRRSAAAVGAPAGGGAPATAATASPDAAPAAAPAAPAVIVLRPMRPREVLFVLRSACGGDVRALCPGVEPGGGRIIECLATQAASLSPACKDVLTQFSAQ